MRASPMRPVRDAAPRDDLGARLEALLSQQEALCRELEGLADSLPARVDTHRALALALGLHPALRRCHRLEETVIFPALATACDDLAPVLDRLRIEHMEDEDHAGDVRDAVAAFVARRGLPRDAERIGYMLRGLFVGLRRHVAFERDHVLPIVRGIGRG